MIDLQLLALLDQVDRLGSVAAAAERLHVTPSALSHLVRRVEERHGVKVWHKSGRGLHLSPAGRHLLALARRVLPQIEDAERELSDYAHGRRGALRVGMECDPCRKWLDKLTPGYLAAWPDVPYDVRADFGLQGVQALLAHQIDVLITTDAVPHTGLHFTPVTGYELALVVPRAHRLAGSVCVQPQDLACEEILTVPVPVDRLDVYTRFLMPAQCRPRRHHTIESTGLMLQLVAAGRGVAVLPDWLVMQEGAQLPVRSLRLGSQGLGKQISIGIRQGDEHHAHIAGFIGLAQTHGADVAQLPQHTLR